MSKIPAIIVNAYFNTGFATSTGEPEYTNPAIQSHQQLKGDDATRQQWYQIPIQYGLGTDMWCIFQNVNTGGYAYVDPTRFVSGVEVTENVVATLWKIKYFDGKSTISPAGIPELMEPLYWGFEKDTGGIACTLRYDEKDLKNHWTIMLV